MHRGYRIAVRQDGVWVARITHARGTVMPLSVHASLAEGESVCLARAREAVDRYLAFLESKGRPAAVD